MQSALEQPLAARSGFDAIIGRSPAMAAMLERACMLAQVRVPVLIEGETGVGKELVARALHGGETRPFIAINCGAASKELLAGDLFGHVRGAFTGAAAASLQEPASLQKIEQDTIARAMQRTHGNIAGASRLLGISRSTPYRKLRIAT